MYCGTNKTALQSQRQIAEAMMVLIRQKPYQQITISELCKAAGVSRQTFYTLFTSRENAMVFALQTRSCDVPELEMRRPEAESRQCRYFDLHRLCRGYSAYLLRNQGLIRLLVENGIDHLLYDSFFDALERCGHFLSRADACTRRYAASFYAGGVTCVARQYAQEGCESTAEQLEQLLMTLFTGALF